MPELPEVETTVRSLRPHLKNQIIKRTEVLRANMIEGSKKNLSALTNAKIKAINRVGKYMLLTLSDDQTLILHLRMSGRLGIRKIDDPELRYERARFYLDRKQVLVFNDARTLGRMQLVKTDDLKELKHVLKLGPDPLEISRVDFLNRLEKKRGTLKALLLNQTFLAGIGNIYADEACFEAKVDPRCKAETLTKNEREKLFAAIQSVLKKGIRNMARASRTSPAFTESRGRIRRN